MTELIQTATSEECEKEWSWATWRSQQYNKWIVFQFTAGETDVSFLQTIRTTPGTQLTVRSMVPGALSPEVRRPATEADQSLLLSAEVKNEWRYNSIPPHAFKSEQLCADTKYEHQNIPCVYYSCTYKQVCLHETNVPHANDSYSDGKKCPTFMKRKCNFLSTIHGQQTLSWTSSVQLHLTIELSNNNFGIRTLFPYKIPLSALPSNFRKNYLYEFIFRQLHPSRLSTLIISINTYRRISIFKQMLQDSNDSSRRVS